MYFIKDLYLANPRVGRIILLRNESKLNMMAFRIIKTYYDKGDLFAVRNVKSYNEVEYLNIDDTFTVIEKVHQREVDPNLTPEERKELEELEQNDEFLKQFPKIMPHDPKLDTGSSPIDDIEEDEDYLIEAGEAEEIDKDKHWLSSEIGLIKNYKFDGKSSYYFSGGIKYGLNLLKNVFFNLRDSFTIELGIFRYSIRNYEKLNDLYTIMPILGNIRYNIYINKDFYMFTYLGLIKNIVTDENQGTKENISSLSKTLHSLGIGGMVRIGPKWHLRLDLGFDALAGGFTLRF